MWSPSPPHFETAHFETAHFETAQNTLFVSRGAVSKPTLGGWCRVGPSLRRLSVSTCLLLLVTTGLKASERPWLFSPPKAVEPPQVKRADWIRNPLDAFVLARLDSKGLQPASDASRQTLIRRIYFDLIGLPPRPQEVEAFLTDKDPRAYEQLVDRLLEDQRYGERWARFWLDLARYADTAGYEGDPDLPHAWRYRDYVIDAFNNDMPYDQFIKEQLAGDEFGELMGATDLPDVLPDRVVALTFLRLAPFTEPRGDETRHEMLSEMTSTVASVFLGLTVGCAKCHDHKYDHIPTKDFYRLKAFFATVSIERPLPGDIYQVGGSLPARFYRDGQEQWAEQKRQTMRDGLEEAKTELAEFREELQKRAGPIGAGFGIQSVGTGADGYVFDKMPVADGNMHDSIINCDGAQWQFFTDGQGPHPTGSLAGVNHGAWFSNLQSPIQLSLGQHTAGSGTPQGYNHQGHFAEILIYGHPLDEQERGLLADYIRHKYHGEGESSAGPPTSGLRFWLDAADLDANPETDNPKPGVTIEQWIDKISGIRLHQPDRSKQPKLDQLGPVGGATVKFDGSFLKGDVCGAPFLADGQGALVVIYSATHQDEGYGLEVGGDGQFLSTFINPAATTIKIGELLKKPGLASRQERKRYRYLTSRERFTRQHLVRLEPKAMSLRHSYGPPYEPGVPTSRVMIRGEYDNPGEVVQPGFLSCISGNQDPAAIRLDPFKRWPTRSRRMALATWISSPGNPLTARVMVNRLWNWHFSRGIVSTPSDFGQLSGGPSHPDLLDWLANDFVENKWSIKAMHRRIVTSATYRQASTNRKSAAQDPQIVDPENVLLWKFNRRRLEAEAIRDAVLSVSGRLNPELGGLPIFPPLPGNIAEAVKYDQSKWDTQYGKEGRKRSIYIYQQRTLTMPLMQMFDALVCDESRPRRRSSVTALQALAMYNGMLVNEESHHFAERVQSETGDLPETQINHAFRLALSRRPTPAEAAYFADFFRDNHDSDGNGPDPLVALCRILYNTNEFIYID